MSDKPYRLLQGYCLKRLKELPDNSVDSVVTDPPYGLGKEPDMAEVLRHWMAGDDYQHKGGGFMGRKWDSFVPGPAVWREALRVLKPGGHLLAFFGTRTYDMGTLAVRLAGFEIRDQIAWVYGSGFPKSRNVGREVEGFDGWGTALKPAQEPIVVARKPLAGTVAANVLAHGTGALNVDGCRIGMSGGEENPSVARRKGAINHLSDRPAADTEAEGKMASRQSPEAFRAERSGELLGRWPANLIHDGSDEVLAAFPDSKGQQGDVKGTEPSSVTNGIYGEFTGRVASAKRVDQDKSAARFFYCAKASPRDRNEGLDAPGPQFKHGSTLRNIENTKTRGNNHPTVKPTDLMAYLCRLVTPPGGTVLDPFMGSGSTGKAAIREGFQFIGIELDRDENDQPVGYINISEARIRFELHERSLAKQQELEL